MANPSLHHVVVRSHYKIGQKKDRGPPHERREFTGDVEMLAGHRVRLGAVTLEIFMRLRDDEDPVLRRQQFRSRRNAGAALAGGRKRDRSQSASVPPRQPRHRVEPHARAAQVARSHHACSPLAQGELPANARLEAYAKTLGMTAAQLALGWLLAQDEVIVIPKTGRRERLRENLR